MERIGIMAVLFLVAGGVSFATGSFWMFVERPLFRRRQEADAEILERQGVIVFLAGFLLLLTGIALW